MSGKTKKTTTTGDKTHQNGGDTPNISLASSKIVKRLSLSFYGEDIMKQQKQIIFDTYDDQIIKPQKIKTKRNHSHSVKKGTKPKIPILNMKLQEKKKKKQEQEQGRKSIKKKVQRSLSRSSKGTINNSQKNKLLKYVCKRIDSGAKGWKTIKNIFKDKPKGI